MIMGLGSVITGPTLAASRADFYENGTSDKLFVSCSLGRVGLVTLPSPFTGACLALAPLGRVMVAACSLLRLFLFLFSSPSVRSWEWDQVPGGGSTFSSYMYIVCLIAELMIY